MIGVFPTILIVITTAVIGTALLRQQGLATLQRSQQRMAQGALPAQEMIEGLALVFGGALLLTPGFVTDALGLLCLIPVTRQIVVRWLLKRFSIMTVTGMGGRGAPRQPQDGGSGAGRRDGRTLEGEYSVKDDD